MDKASRLTEQQPEGEPLVRCSRLLQGAKVLVHVPAGAALVTGSMPPHGPDEPRERQGRG